MHTLGSGVWRENGKTWKMRHKYSMTSHMARNIQKHGKSEMHTVGPGVWQEK